MKSSHINSIISLNYKFKYHIKNNITTLTQKSILFGVFITKLTENFIISTQKKNSQYLRPAGVLINCELFWVPPGQAQGAPALSEPPSPTVIYNIHTHLAEVQ